MTKLYRYGLALTYRCNLSCRYCNRFLDQVCWDDSDVALTDLEIGAERIKQHSIEINRIRFTGGEPLLHPQFAEITKLVREQWNPTRCLVVLTSHMELKPQEKLPVRYSWHIPGKVSNHRPWAISPADLGIKPVFGFGRRECWVQSGCGRLFDAYGFGACVHVGSLGRVLDLDLYSPTPVERCNFEMCKHCICTLPKRQQWELQAAAARGEIEYPTKTYQIGFERLKAQPYQFKRFQER